MTINYSDMVAQLAKPGKEIADNITETEAHLLHMVIGICGEAGELLDAIKKAVIYKKPLDVYNVYEELGDIEFYMEGLRQAMGVTREETLTANVQKLLKRYPNYIYSNADAQARADKSEEDFELILEDDENSLQNTVEE